MAWTQFWDMHSGGEQKLEWAQVFIEAPESQAREVFTRMFDRDADNVTCECCGEDYSVSEYATLEEATEFQRTQALPGSKAPMSLDVYRAQSDVRIVIADEWQTAHTSQVCS